MNRTQILLGVLLLAQLALIAVCRSPLAGGESRAAARPLVPALEAVTPSRLEILGADGRALELTRAAGGWTVDGAGGFPADAGKIDGLIENLRGLVVRRPVVTGSRYHESFAVTEDDAEARIRLWDDAAGEPAADVILGSSPNYRTTYVRLGGADEVFEVRGLSAVDLRPEPDAWIDKELTQVDASRLTALTLTNAHGTLRLTRQEEAWTTAAEPGETPPPLDEAQVEELVRAATSLRLAGAAELDAAQADPFGEAVATLELKLAPETEGDPPVERSIRVGAVVEGASGRRYLRWSGSALTATIWDSAVRRLIDLKPEDLRAS